MSRLLTIAAVAAAAIVVIAPLTGCSELRSEPITLTIGTNDADDTSVAEEIRYFAEQVDRASGGAITIDPEFRAGGDSAPHWDQNVADRVVDGDLDLGAVPTRAWDALGVTSLRALSAPFVIASDQALVGATAAAVQDPMLAGLKEAGVVGLDLWPESLRHPNAWSEPLLGPDDYAGAVIRTPYSETVGAMFTALGATVDDGAPDPAVHRGMETSYVRAAGSVVTANVTFFGKFDALVVNADRWASLTDDQRRILDQASAATQAWVVDNLPTDADQAAEYCDRGGSLVTASADDVAALANATDALTADLREDAVTAAAIDALLALAPAAAPDPPSCGAADAADVVIDGTFEFTTTQQQLEEGGVTDPQQVHEEAATFRFRFSGTAWTYDAVADYPLTQPTRSGTFSVDGNRITIYWSGKAQDNTSADVEILPDGSLQFSNVVDADPKYQKSSEVKFADHPWTRTG